jgi:hypothetical protein
LAWVNGKQIEIVIVSVRLGTVDHNIYKTQMNKY